MRALLSVANRDGIAALARDLLDLGVDVVATDGTRDHLANEGVAVAAVSSLTQGEPDVGGQVKTFHHAVYAGILALWFGFRDRLGRAGFYALFAVAVTLSVQLVGLYLVFATLIVPPLATRHMTRNRLPAAWALGAAGYAGGLVLSTTADLPSGPMIVWVLVAVAVLVETMSRMGGARGTAATVHRQG